VLSAVVKVSGTGPGAAGTVPWPQWQAGTAPVGGGVSGAVWAVSPSSEGMPLPGRNFPTRTSEWLPTVYQVRIAATRGLRGCSAAMLSQPTPDTAAAVSATRRARAAARRPRGACLKIPRQDKTELGTC